jgi:hypothetical protein
MIQGLRVRRKLIESKKRKKEVKDIAPSWFKVDRRVLNYRL